MINLKRSVYEGFKNWKSNHSNRALFVKGDNYGGINDKSTTITIPIYLFPKFKFDVDVKDKKLVV